MAYTETYTGSDLGSMFIDLFGGFVNGVTQNIDTIVILIVVGLIAFYGRRALDGIFGIFRSF